MTNVQVGDLVKINNQFYLYEYIDRYAIVKHRAYRNAESITYVLIFDNTSKILISGQFIDPIVSSLGMQHADLAGDDRSISKD